VITGRGPGAPGVVPSPACRSGPARAGTAGQAVDLGAIRRTDDVLDLLAGRRLCGRQVSDSVLALLAGLVADVDSPPAPAPVRGQASAALAVAAVIAGMGAATWLAMTQMLLRLARRGN
jgi:hypothetical protein